MARVRLFANLRELAGASEVEIEGDTVGAVLDEAADRYGQEFKRSLGHARVWLNGEPAQAQDPVGRLDEVALIPPVSGGAATLTVGAIQVALITVALLVANAFAEPAWFIAALVGAGAIWVWDISGDDELGRPFRLPVLLAVLAGSLATYGFEVVDLVPAGRGIGLGVAAGLAVVITLVSAVFSPRHRSLVSLVSTAVVALAATLAVGSLILVRIQTVQGQDLIWVFLAMVIVGKAAAGLLAAAKTPTLDPLTGAVVATVLTAAATSFVWDLNLFALFLIGVFVAIGLVAGISMGSLLRVGEVYLTDAVEGSLVALDGPVLAALVYAPFITLLL
ncbi:MAG TPA: MoaD/ThiS family protein [Acidimicrobiia bacterium]|nr:MoaD/ThiS family protein [Acidimicrobiia bacterium]